MTISKKPYKGTRDLFPPQKRFQDHLFQVMAKTAESFGYEPYDGPLLEEVELYYAKSGEELVNQQIYSFEDRGKRMVAIRPEMTPTCARMVAQVVKEASLPLRWYSIPNLMRYERPQRGRLREHWQLNVDIFGGDFPFAEAEILQVLVSLFENLGASGDQFGIYINDRKMIDSLTREVLQLSDEKSYALVKLLDRSKKISQEELNQEGLQLLGEEGHKIFSQYLQLNTFRDLNTFLDKLNLSHLGKRLEDFSDQLKIQGIDQYVSFDPTIVRGLDYYTGVVFEVFDRSSENNRAMCGGGTYDDLLKIFGGPAVGGVGFGLGDVTLENFCKTHNLRSDFQHPPLDLYLTFQEEGEGRSMALNLAQRLRKAGQKVQTHFSPIKIVKGIKLAGKKGVSAIGLIGPDELAKGEVTLKKLVSGIQKSFPSSDHDQIIAFLNKGS